MRHLPIEDGADIALPVEEKISRAVIAMHDGELLRGWRRIAFQPADGRARDRLRLALVFVDDFFPTRDFVAPGFVRVALAFQIAETDGVDIRGRDASEHIPELSTDFLAMSAIGIGIENGGDLTSRDLFHDEERPLQRFCFEFEHDGLGNRKTETMKRLI